MAGISFLEIQALLDCLYLSLSSLDAALIVGSFLEAGILDFCIELDLWLSTRWTNRNLCTILAEPLQNVAGVWHVQLLYTSVSLLCLQGLIVFPQTNLTTAKLLWRIGTEVGHHLLNLVGTGLTRTNHVDGYLLRESVFLIDIHQQIVEGHTIVASPCSNLANQTD